MALTSSIVYCTDSDLTDCYPHISEYSFKRRIYNLQLDTETTNWTDTSLDAYHAQGNGVIKDLYQNGNKMGEYDYNNVLVVTQLNGAISTSTVSITVDASGGIEAGDIIKVGTEYMLVTGKNSSTNIVVNRGVFGTTVVPQENDANIYIVLNISGSVTDATSVSEIGQFVFDTDLDLLIIVGTADMPNQIIEAGEDWTNVKLRFRKKASRLIESYLDSRLSREVMKDREGSCPEIIVRATALQTILLILKAHDPQNEIIDPLQAELDEILDGLRSGAIVLPTAVSSDSSKGVIREVSVNSGSDLRPVELKGNYHVYGYDNIMVKVITGGIIGTSTYSVWVKGNDSLKSEQVVTAEKITGDFDHIYSGLYIRFSGDDVTTAVTNANDEYEIEVHSSGINSSVSSIGSVSMSRR